MAILLLTLLGCTSEPASTTRAQPAATVAPEIDAPAERSPSPVQAPTPSPSPPPPPTAVATPTVTPVPTVAPVAMVPVSPGMGEFEAAMPGTYLIARPEAGVLLDNGARIVPVYDEPGGEPRVLVDVNDIDGVRWDYPLRSPTLFDQPLVLRVVAGTPTDDWVLVQAPVRPHRQFVWVRAADFTFGETDMRIEVDVGRDGRLALFDGELEIIANESVYGKETRPTTLHDTYVEQAFDASVLSPAYGTHILTLASYSQALGTFGGGNPPGQSIHGTNQPELVGQAVSSGGIRVPNEIIDFIYQQPGLLGASVIIYDSTGVGRDAAIDRQRNKPWQPAITNSFSETDPPPVVATSYS